MADLLAAYEAQPYAAVDMLYNEFKSVIQQRLVVKTLLAAGAVSMSEPVMAGFHL